MQAPSMLQVVVCEVVVMQRRETPIESSGARRLWPL